MEPTQHSPAVQHAPPALTAPFAMVRLCGLPAAQRYALRATATTELLARAEEATARAGAAAPELADALAAAVPAAPDKAVRRSLLDLRRDVHNGRLTRRTLRTLAAAGAALEPGALGRAKEWAAHHRRALALRDQARTALDADLLRAAHALRQALSVPALRAALALTAPEAARVLLVADAAALAAPKSRPARTATAYLTRAMLKTSPNSSLTVVGTAAFAPPGPGACWTGAPDRTVARHLVGARPQALHLLLDCAADPELSRAVELAWHDGCREVDGELLAALPWYVPALGTLSRIDELTAVDAYGGLLFGPPPRPCAPDPGAAALARRLVRAGLVRPVAPWGPYDTDALGPLAKALRHAATSRAGELACHVERLAACVARLPQATAKERLAVHSEAGAAFDGACAVLRRQASAEVRSAPPAHETVTVGPCGTLPATVRDDLVRLGERLADRTVRSALYGVLVSAFVARYGTGGRCTDILAFLHSVARRPGHHHTLRQALAADSAAGADRSRERDPLLGGYGSLAPATATVAFQVAAYDEAAVREGAHLTVVNKVHLGGAGLLARWAAVPGVDLATELGDWLRALHPGHHALQVAPFSEVSGMQIPQPGLLPLLRLPGDLPSAAWDEQPACGLDDLTLHHDVDSGTLQLTDRDGGPVALIDLSVVPAHLLSGPVRLLLLLANPWACAEGRPEPVPALAYREPVALGRVQEGRLVTSRRRWYLPAQLLPWPDPGDDDLTLLARAARFARTHGLPTEVFVTDRSGSGRHKPCWLAFDSPHALRAAFGALRAATGPVELTEVLPGTDGCWVRDDEGAPRATEFLTSVRLTGAPALHNSPQGAGI